MLNPPNWDWPTLRGYTDAETKAVWDVIRRANSEDLVNIDRVNKESVPRAIKTCKELIQKLNLEMKVTDVDYVYGGERVIQANGIPDHQPGQFPNRGNPNTISEQNYSFRIPTKPQVAPIPTSSTRWWFGVAINGVPFEPGTAEFWNGQREWNYEAKGGFINLGLDENDAHVQPQGSYHYHGWPAGLIARLGGDGHKMLLVGWAADGFSIYTAYDHTDLKDARSPLKKMRSSYRVKQGQRPDGPGGNYDGRFTADYEFVQGAGDLDECNGCFGVTPEYPEGVYHYHLSDGFPYISRRFRGSPDSTFQKGPGPGFARRGPGPGRPPGDSRGGRPGGPGSGFGPPPRQNDE
jgi:hypothetical protein